MGVRGHLLQVLDPAEPRCRSPAGCASRLEQDDITLIGDVDGVRARYRHASTPTGPGLQDLARSLGWTFATHLRPAARARFAALYTALSTKGQG